MPTGKEITRGSLTFSASSNTIKKSTNLIFKEAKKQPFNYGMDVFENDKNQNENSVLEHEYGVPSVRYSSIATRVETTSNQHRILTPLRDKKNHKKLAIPGQVMWIAPESCERGTQGLGIQFIGTTKAKVKLIIETMLGNRANVPPLVRFY